MKGKRDKTNVVLGGGYRSNKTTEKYTPDTAPINYQDQNNDTPAAKPCGIERVVLKEEKVDKKITIDKSFLESITTVYISGNYPVKGNTALKVKDILLLISRNAGGYKIRVNPSLKNSLIDVISFGDSSLFGRKLSKYEREGIINIFKSDNI
jgi:hypothetical protein